MRMVCVYSRKIARLKTLVADWEMEGNGQQELLSLNGTKEKSVDRTERKAESGRPEKISEWIRFAVSQSPDRVMVPIILDTIKSASPTVAEKIDSSRVSTTLFQWYKDDQLVIVAKSPGKATHYQVTPKFKLWATARIDGKN